MTSDDRWEIARKVFRRDTAKQAWWLIIFEVLVTTGIGLSSRTGSSIVAAAGPTLATLLVAPVSLVLGYLGVSAWENTAQRRRGRYQDDYGDDYSAPESSQYERETP